MYRFSNLKKERRTCLTEGFKGLAQGVDHHCGQLDWLVSPDPKGFFRHLEVRLCLLELYQDFFPCQWQQSSASSVVVDWAVHTPRELEFFDCIDEFRFPCERDNIDFEPNLVITPLNSDLSEEDWEEVGCLAHCYMGLCGYADWQQVIDHYHLQSSDIDIPLPCERIRNTQLEKHCQQLQSPLKALCEAFEIIEHCTGNVWLDSSYMDPSYFSWSHETIESLTVDLAEAQLLHQGFNALDKWLTEDPTRLGAVVKLWNNACTDPEDAGHVQLELPLITTISSTDFVAGIRQQELRTRRPHYQESREAG